MLCKRLKASKVIDNVREPKERYVLLMIKKGKTIEFSTNLEIMPSGRLSHLAYGDYGWLGSVDAYDRSFVPRMEKAGVVEDTTFVPDERFMEF